MKHVVVVGSPIKHSRSPLIHRYWLRQHGLQGNYERLEVVPDELPTFLSTLGEQGLAGCNITLPHKERAARVLHDYCDDRAKRIGSVNTVYFERGDLSATSTDGVGFVNNLIWRKPGIDFNGMSAVILGAGGSSRAVIDELLRRGAFRITVLNRTQSRADALKDLFGPSLNACGLDGMSSAIESCQLLVNTTSIGVAEDGSLPIDFSRLPKNALITDINYVPLVTPFLRSAEAAGLQTVGGLGMLLHQAVFGFSKWFGVTPDVTQDLHDLIAHDIDRDCQR